MDFKVGDKVRIKKDADTSSWNIQGLMEKWRGKVMTISAICGDSIFVEECKNENFGLGWMWSKEDFEKVEERKEDMENLKEKMEITTLVQLRDGRIGLIFRNPNSKDKKGIYNPKHCGCISYLSSYKDNLTNSDSYYDIMKVKFPDNNDNYHLVSRFFAKSGELELPSTFKWDWERKEDPVTKDVSLEELNAILKEKFPDVDRFNLPIQKAGD